MATPLLLAAPALSLLPLPSCLAVVWIWPLGFRENLETGACSLWTKNEGHRKAPRTPKGPAWLQKHWLHCRFQSHCTLALCLEEELVLTYQKSHNLDISLPGPHVQRAFKAPHVRLLAAASRRHLGRHLELRDGTLFHLEFRKRCQRRKH